MPSGCWGLPAYRCADEELAELWGGRLICKRNHSKASFAISGPQVLISCGGKRSLCFMHEAWSLGTSFQTTSPSLPAPSLRWGDLGERSRGGSPEGWIDLEAQGHPLVVRIENAFLAWRGWNPRPHACWVSILPLSYVPDLRTLIFARSSPP